MLKEQNMNFVEVNETTDLVKIEMENGDSIVVELDATYAPITVSNFKNLVGRGFYDGLIFHRVINGFMIQGGDPLGNGTGGSRPHIKGEFTANGVPNPLSHERGVISMARSVKPDSASSQFFICQADAKFLDGQYASFGRVVEGMETVDRIASVQTSYYENRPYVEQKMKRVYFVKQA